MPVQKTVQSKKIIPQITEPVVVESQYSSTITNLINSKLFYIVAIILLLLSLAFYKKAWFVAAMVNNSPVTSWELFSRMNQQHRQKTLDQLVDEKLILMEARKRGISISDEDVAAKIKELETNYGGAQVFDSLLEQEGLTRDGIKSQIKSTLLMEKMYSSEATVSDEEVAQFLENNSALIQATDSAEQEKQAREMLREQKLGQLYGEKFKQLKDSAQVKKF